MKSKFLSVGIALSLLLISSGCTDEGAAGVEKKIIRIGLITDLTGPSAEMGQEQKRILDYRISELNKQNDFLVELMPHDGQCTVEGASEAMKQLVNEENVPFVIGGLCATATFAAVPVTEDGKSILVSATVGNKQIEGLGPNAFSLAFPEDSLVQEIANELHKYKNVAILSEKAEKSTMMEETLDDLIAANFPDLKIVFEEKFETDTVDFSTLVTGLKDSGADVVFLNPATGKAVLPLMRALDESGLKLDIIGQDTFDDAEIIPLLPDIAENMLIIQSPKISDPNFEKEKSAIGATGSIQALNDYQVAATLDSIDLLTKLISENAGDVESVQTALSTGTFNGRIGKIHFGGKAFSDNQRVLRQRIKDHQPVGE